MWRVVTNEVGKTWRAVKQAGRLFYDYLGLSMLISSYWFLLAYLPVHFMVNFSDQLWSAVVETGMLNLANLGFTIVLWIIVLFVWAPTITAVASSLIYSLIDGEGFLIRDLILRIPRHFKKAAGTGTIALIILIVLVVDAMYFLQLRNKLLNLLTVLFVYLTVFWFFGIQYLYPFIVQQSVTVRKTLYRAALVALDNVIASAVLFVFGAAIFYISFVLHIPLILGFMSFVGAAHHFALIEILKKYDDPPTQAEDV